MRRDSISRRDVLRLAGSTAALAAAPVVLATDRASASDVTSRAAGGRPRNIIFMVSDGMSMGVPTMAESFSQLVRSRGTVWNQLLADRSIAQGLLSTPSLSSPVTDSSAASSAWSSGRRVANGAVNIYPDGTPLQPIAAMCKDKDVRVGLVTTDHVCGGTPAGFAAVQKKRSNYQAIAQDYLNNVHVILGGGHNVFRAEKREDKIDLLARYSEAGYAIQTKRSSLAGKSPANKMLGLFSEDVAPFTIDHRQNETLLKNVPTLAEMSSAALRSLTEAPQGFFLMIEGARIDHAAHVNDAASMLWEQLAFDDAIAVALEYARQRDDTLVVITSDHGNSNPGLNGVGSGYRRSGESFARLAGFKASFPEFSAALKKGAAESDPIIAAKSVLQHTTGLELSDAEARIVSQAWLADDLPEELSNHHRNKVGVLGQIVGNYIGVGWSGVSHTSDNVLLSAFGPGAEHFACLQHHTEAHACFTDLLNLDSRNPVNQDSAA